MIYFNNGDLFNSKAEVYINPVNCVGVMGKGIALIFKKRYPDMFTRYKEICDKHLLSPGVLHVYTTHIEQPKYIINFPTKQHWRYPSQYDWIELGLLKLQKVIEHLDIQSIAMPALGCGNGGLSWEKVKTYLHKYLDQFKHVNITIYNL